MPQTLPPHKEGVALVTAETKLSAPDDWLIGGGEMAKLVKTKDWSGTPLGPIDTWPQSLRTVVNLVQASNSPISLSWGPGHIQIYNDGYWPLCGAKHPTSMGQDYRECWASAFPVIGAAYATAWAGKTAYLENMRMFLDRYGFLEETWFTFSFSPITDESGQVGGVFHPVTELTSQLLSQRRTKTLRDLAAAAGKCRTAQEAFEASAHLFSESNLDLPFALFYVVDEAGRTAQLVAQAGLPAGTPMSPTLVDLNAPDLRPWPISDLLRGGLAQQVNDVASGLVGMTVGPYPELPSRAFVLPITLPGREHPVGVMVAGVSSRLRTDDPYRSFLELVAASVSAALANARAHEDERRKSEALAEIDRAKTAFFSNISHEFRTPLTLLLGPLESLLARRQLDTGTQEPLAQMHRNALRLLRLVNALLDFSRVEAGRHSARFVPTNLARYTVDLASIFRSAVEKAGLSFEVTCPPLPVPIYVDRDMWEKIVMNLLSNALKFTFEGGVVVRLEPVPGGARLTVKDTGIGIPRSELPKVFQRFHRVEGAHSRSHEGTGIGLALVHEFVGLHGGQLHVASDEGKGTEFTIVLRAGRVHLPPEQVVESSDTGAVARSAAAYLDEALQWLPYESQTVASTSAQSGGRVLVADDNSDLRTFLTSLLAPHYDVQAVADGREALAAIQARKPDLILSDVMMPGLDGLGLVRALRENPETSTLPVILLSARAGQEASLEGLSAGADDYLAKPFTSQELLARVRTHLTLARMRDELVAKLTQANEDLRAFTSSVSHDLRAPLRALDGFAGMLEEDHGPELGDEGRRKIGIIRNAVRKAADIVEALLALSRIGYQAIQRTRFDTRTLVAQVCADLTLTNGGSNAEISIGSLPETWGDHSLLRQAWVNLISNALKYSGTRPRPRVQLYGFDADEESVFCVKDNGVGFDMCNIDRLFGIFQRLHHDEQFSGTGVGLAIVKRIVGKHLGRVWAESTLDEGAAFFFSLPRENKFESQNRDQP